jgi:dihydrolipoamide dehydrogenase
VAVHARKEQEQELAEHQVDTVVIGAGPGGYHVAIRLGQLGKKVLCVDRDEVGGVCLNWGCIPTKALLHVGEVIRHIERAGSIGLNVPKADVDRQGVAKFKTEVVNANVGGVKTLFKANGVEFLYGEASFKSPTEIAVKKSDGEIDTIKATNVVIATGSAPIDVKAWPRDGETIINSDDAVQVKRIPKNLLIIGGGVIGLEFATVYARMGANALVVEMLPQILTGTDVDIAKALGRILKKQGVEIMLATKVGAIKKDGKTLRATLNGEGTGGKDETRDFDMVLVAVGRRPVTDNLNLHAAGLAADDKGFIAVDQQLRTKVPNIFAIGDVTGQPLLAHRAMKQGVIAAEVIAGDKAAAFDPVAVPNCVYTDPEVATVGLSEEEAKAKGYEVRIGKFPLAASGRARTMNDTDGLIKLVGDAKSDLLLGMHIVAPQAESLIGEGVIALEMGATLEDIGLSVHPHPTLTEGIMDAAEAAHGKAIHIVNPKPKAPTAAGVQ